MRIILFFLGLVALILALLMMVGWIQLSQTREASMPRVNVEGGQTPEFDADVGDIDVGSKNETVTVPDVRVNKPAANETER
ncbi:hypothetical protein [Stakelama saccharophila]|uniref:Uncharacterized protein n=1 Tax=Stakelama saccharophila TaxID=3075605 RepID=A0ABZ0BBL9_9SPHN|nr:hypothetical protein [Stakelama sp. W311]WNO54748.1 hypothetical protein RPR59_05735 [Stakelama sp. W311]